MCVGGRVVEGVWFVALGVKIRSVDGVVYVFLGGKIMIHILFGSIWRRLVELGSPKICNIFLWREATIRYLKGGTMNLGS